MQKSVVYEGGRYSVRAGFQDDEVLCTKGLQLHEDEVGDKLIYISLLILDPIIE